MRVINIYMCSCLSVWKRRLTSFNVCRHRFADKGSFDVATHFTAALPPSYEQRYSARKQVEKLSVETKILFASVNTIIFP